MAASELQIGKLISRLLEKTEAGALSWEPGLRPGSYRTRIHDFVVELRKPLFATLGSHQIAEIEVMKLNGSTIARAGERNALMSDNTALSPEAEVNLRRLYDIVANRDDEIDKLIDLL